MRIQDLKLRDKVYYVRGGTVIEGEIHGLQLMNGRYETLYVVSEKRHDNLMISDVYKTKIEAVSKLASNLAHERDELNGKARQIEETLQGLMRYMHTLAREE